MLRALTRLYLVTIVTFSAAIYLVPDLVVSVFHERFSSYNLDHSRGVQNLLVQQFQGVPREQWPALAAQLDQQFKPIRIAVVPISAFNSEADPMPGT